MKHIRRYEEKNKSFDGILRMIIWRSTDCFLSLLFLPPAVFQPFFILLFFALLFSSFLIPFRSAGRDGYTSAEENEKPVKACARDAHNSDNRDFISYKPRL